MNGSGCKKFEQELLALINNSGITIVDAYYIVENAALQLKSVYERLVVQEQMSNSPLEETHEVAVNIPVETVVSDGKEGE